MTETRTVGSGRYQLAEQIGAGGMARVFGGIDAQTGAPVAIKLLREHFAADPTTVARFRNEAAATISLRHPNIVQVLDVGEDAGIPFIVMEIIHGSDLRQRVLTGGPVAIGAAIEIAEQLCQALTAAHERGIVHRDVKPQNVLLDERPGGGTVVKLTDFGIARALGTVNQTRAGEVLGSVHYLSPEQLRGKPATPHSDIYAAGCVLYEMLTGRPPFEGETDIAVAMQHLQEMPVPPGQRRAGVPRGLDEIVMRCLAKDPAQRFQSAAALGDALHRFDALSQGATTKFEALPEGATKRLDAAAIAQIQRRSRNGGYTPPAPPPKPLPAKSPAGTAVNVVLLTGLAVFFLTVAGLAFTFVTVFVPQQQARQATTVAQATPVPPAAPTAKPEPPTPAAKPTAAPAPTATVPPKRAVPALTGLAAADARAALEKLGFKYREVEGRFDEQVPAGNVVSQNPPQNAEVENGSTVEVALSRGTRRVRLPSVVGTPAGAASEQLQALGLTVKVQEEFNANVPAGTVMVQEPKAGETVDRGTAVSLNVSKGPEVVKVPNVVGLSEEEAKRRILATGKLKLWPFGVNYQGHDTLPDNVLRQVPVGAVLSTRPAPGTDVAPGTEVAIAVRKD